jgi:hypothetical protein
MNENFIRKQKPLLSVMWFTNITIKLFFNDVNKNKIYRFIESKIYD